MSQTKDLLMDATMEIIAQTGFAGFSMKQVTQKVGVNEALIYKYFETKENLLNQCFESIHKQVAQLYTNTIFPKTNDFQEIYLFVRNLWMNYFDFLVQNDYRTIFYFEYRDSIYVNNILKDSLGKDSYFSNFVVMMHALYSYIGIQENANAELFWDFILDTTGMMAKRVIRQEMKDVPQVKEQMWQLIYGGASAFLKNGQ